jgi:hypothetical protein
MDERFARDSLSVLSSMRPRDAHVRIVQRRSEHWSLNRNC